MILRIILYGFLAYLLYNIIFRFIIPVYKTTRQVKKGFRDMQSRMNEHMNNQQQEDDQQNKTRQSSFSQKPVDDYIDFEEIK
jgi:hypothetical protein